MVIVESFCTSYALVYVKTYVANFFSRMLNWGRKMKFSAGTMERM